MLPTTPIVFLAIFSAVSARPKLQRRGLPGASYTCTGADFSGNCQWNQPSDRCRDDGAAKGKPNGILSLGPDEGGSCDLFSEPGCKGEKLRSLTRRSAARLILKARNTGARGRKQVRRARGEAEEGGCRGGDGKLAQSVFRGPIV
jgi:hypothetical protein